MVDLVKKFHRAGRARLDAAQYLALAENDRYLLDALYLGGYSIECSLKSMILSETIPADQESFAEDHFRGQIGHDFESLYCIWLDNGCESLPKVLLDLLRRAKLKWTTDLRYESNLGRRKKKDVAEMLSFGEELWTWVERRL